MAVVTGLLPLRFSSEEHLEICPGGLMAGHSVAADGGALLITSAASRAAIAISGEADEATGPALAETLKRLTAGLDLVHLHLAGLEYCDLAGLRVIVNLAAASDHRRQVVLHEVSPHLMLVMCILGWDTTPGLVFHQRAEYRPARLIPAARPGAAGWRPRYSGQVLRALGMLMPGSAKAGT